MKHGMTGTRLHFLWIGMIHRCYTESDTNYYKYGAKGITVCDEWRNSFQAFYEWSMKNGYSDELTIDRIDNDKGYSPDNCRWATVLDQANNRRNVKLYDFNGKQQSLPNWCRELNLNYKCVRTRVKVYGWPIEKALNTPTNKKCEV